MSPAWPLLGRQFNFDTPVSLSHRPRPHALVEAVGVLAGAEAEVKPVPWAGHVSLESDPQPEASALMGAGVIQGKEFALVEEHRELARPHGEGEPTPIGRELVMTANRGPLLRSHSTSLTGRRVHFQA